MVVACVCFIGAHNEPLSLQFFDTEDALSMQFAVYAAVDVIEEKLQTQQQPTGHGAYGSGGVGPPGATSASTGPAGAAAAAAASSAASAAAAASAASAAATGTAASAECFLGAICPALCLTRDYLLYAYVPTTGVKIVAAIEQRSQYSSQDIRSLFRRLHRLYADSVCNPFLLGSIETPVFLRQLDAIVAYYSKKLEEGT